MKLFAGTDGGLYRSTNGGASWTLQSHTIGTRRVTSIVVSSEFATDRTLYCGSNYGGVLRSTDGGTTWANFVNGLGHTYVQTMGISPGANPTVFAGTVGGSVWQYSYSGPFQRALGEGWQLLSIPRILVNNAPETVLASIAGKYSAVYAYDASDLADPWKSYAPGIPGGDLTALSNRMGLWIRMTEAATLTVEGDMPATTSIPLYAGWNLIGYPSGTTRAVPDALASIAGKYTLVYEYDTTAPSGWRSYSPAVPDFANTLQQMRPGFGYWVRATEDCTLTVGW